MGSKMAPGQNKENGWLGFLNHQGLMKPTPEFIKLLSEFERDFSNFHGESLSLENDPILKLGQILKEKYKTVPSELLFFYSKVRFFIRLKHLNKQLDLDINESKKKNNTHINKYF